MSGREVVNEPRQAPRRKIPLGGIVRVLVRPCVAPQCSTFGAQRDRKEGRVLRGRRAHGRLLPDLAGATNRPVTPLKADGAHTSLCSHYREQVLAFVPHTVVKAHRPPIRHRSSSDLRAVVPRSFANLGSRLSDRMRPLRDRSGFAALTTRRLRLPRPKWKQAPECRRNGPRGRRTWAETWPRWLRPTRQLSLSCLLRCAAGVGALPAVRLAPPSPVRGVKRLPAKASEASCQ